MQQKARQQRQIAIGAQRANSERLQGLLNVEQFAEALGWSPSTVRMKVWKREVEFVRMGRSIRFRPETLHRLIEENTVPAQSR
jgi:excisionase family DNA binding protein